jgi:hypothetical protein
MKPVFLNEDEALSAPYRPLKDYVGVKPVRHQPKQKAESGSIWMRLLLIAVGFCLFTSILWSASNF